MINVGFQCRPSQPIDLWSRPPFALLQSVSFFWGGGGSASIIIIRQNRIFLVRSVCVCVCSCSTSVWDKSLLGCANCVCVRVLGCWCCCWDYEGCSALVGMRGELLGHILGTPRRWEHQSVTRAGQRGRKRCRCSSNDLQLIAPHADTHTHTPTAEHVCTHANMLAFISRHLILHQIISTPPGLTVFRGPGNKWPASVESASCTHPPPPTPPCFPQCQPLPPRSSALPL